MKIDDDGRMPRPLSDDELPVAGMHAAPLHNVAEELPYTVLEAVRHVCGMNWRISTKEY